MNRIKSLTLSLLAAIAIVACSKQEDEVAIKEHKVLKVSMPDDFQSKVSMGNLGAGHVPQFWNTGDCIAVVEGRGTSLMKYSVYKLIGEGNGPVAEFEYVSGNADISGAVDVVYPVSAAVARGAVLHSQEYTSGGYDPASVVLSWHGENGLPTDETITLANESAVLCLQYTGEQEQKVSLIRVKIRLSDGTYDTYVLSKRGGVALSSTPSAFFVSVPEVPEATEVVFETVLTDQSVMRITSSDKLFKPGVIYRFPSTPFVANVESEEGYDVFLCIGQSNMAGRGEVLAEDKGERPGIYLLDESGDIVPASIPFNIYSTIRGRVASQRFGLHNVFADEIYAHTGRKVLLVVNARGGTSIPSWLKGADPVIRSEARNDEEELWGQEVPGFYDEAVRRTVQAMAYGPLKGILWHQGEGDSTPYSSGLYLERLKSMVADLRHDIGVDESVPFVLGQISGVHANSVNMNPVLLQCAEDIPNAFCVTSENCDTQSDNVHFSRAGYITLGKRYSEIILNQVYGIKAD